MNIIILTPFLANMSITGYKYKEKQNGSERGGETQQW